MERCSKNCVLQCGNMEQIKKMLEDERIAQSAWIKASDLNFYREVVEACEANRCGKYGRSWTCPPAVGTLEELKEKLLGYNDCFVFSYIGRLEDSYDFEGMTSSQEAARVLLEDFHQKLKACETEHLRLGCGSCGVCESCTYPEPCRYPEKAVVSVEACGINVSELASFCNINYHNGANTVTYFMMLLFKN